MAHEGVFRCPDCDEPFRFELTEAGIPEFKDAYLQVAHIHDSENPDGIWTAYAYRRKLRQHYPATARTLRLVVDEQRKASR